MFGSSHAGRFVDSAELFACQSGQNISWNTGIPTNGPPDSNGLARRKFAAVTTIATARTFGSIHDRPDQTHRPRFFSLIMHARLKNSPLDPDVFIVEAFDNENYPRSSQTKHLFPAIFTTFRSKKQCGHVSGLLSTSLLSSIASKQTFRLAISKFRNVILPSPGRRNNVFLTTTPLYCAVLTEKMNKISIGCRREYSWFDERLSRITTSRAAPRRITFILGFNATLLAVKKMAISRFSKKTGENLWSCTSVPPFEIVQSHFQRWESDGRKPARA